MVRHGVLDEEDMEKRGLSDGQLVAENTGPERSKVLERNDIVLIWHLASQQTLSTKNQKYFLKYWLVIVNVNAH